MRYFIILAEHYWPAEHKAVHNNFLFYKNGGLGKHHTVKQGLLTTELTIGCIPVNLNCNGSGEMGDANPSETSVTHGGVVFSTAVKPKIMLSSVLAC